MRQLRFFYIGIFSGFCMAQFSYGIKAGLAVPAMFANGADPFTNMEVRYGDYEYKFTDQPFYAGFFGSYKIKGKSNVYADICYANKGLNVEKKVTYPGLVETPTDIKINTPDISMDLRYKHNFLQEKLNASAGIYASKAFKNEMETRTPLVFPEWDINLVAVQKTNFRPYDFGFVFGGEYFLTSHLFFEGVLKFGVLNMVTDETILKITDESLEKAKPVFARALSNANIPKKDKEKITRLAETSDENGRLLSNVEIYRLFTQIGVGWKF